MAVLHPHGKVINFNRHVHVLATEEGLTKRGEQVPVKYVEYRKLRKVYQYELLTTIRKHMPKIPANNRFIGTLFQRYRKGFYVRAKRRVPESERKVDLRYVFHVDSSSPNPLPFIAVS